MFGLKKLFFGMTVLFMGKWRKAWGKEYGYVLHIGMDT